MITLADIARSLIRNGNARATGLVHHQRGDGAQITLMAYDNLDQQRTDHYKVADGYISAEQLPAEDRALLVSA